jgi:four helix bundle protein
MAKRYRFRFKQLDVYQAAVDHFAWTVEVVGRMPRGPFKVVNQALGASLSIMGNVGEANGREKQPGEVEQHYRYAQGSTFESATHLDAFSALQVITDDEYNAAEGHLASIAAMLTRLAQKAGRRRGRKDPGEQAVAAKRAPKARASTLEEPAAAGRGGEKAARAAVEKRGPQGRASNLDRTPR